MMKILNLLVFDFSIQEKVITNFQDGHYDSKSHNYIKYIFSG